MEIIAGKRTVLRITFSKFIDTWDIDTKFDGLDIHDGTPKDIHLLDLIMLDF